MRNTLAGPARALRAGSRFARLPAAERRAVLRAVPLALLAEAGIRVLPLPSLARLAGVSLSSAPPASPGMPSERERRSVEGARRVFSVWRAGRPCLPRAIVIGHILRRRSPVLRIGAAREGGAVRAHAWIEVGGQPVLREPSGFVPLGRGKPRP